MATNKDFVEDAAGIRIIDGIPDNIDEYLNSFYTNIQINSCHTDAINGYGGHITGNVIVSRYCEECVRCDYNSIFRPDPERDCNGHGGRHTLRKGYTKVFEWYFGSNYKLEEAFEMFLKDNKPYVEVGQAKPTKYFYFGPGDYVISEIPDNRRFLMDGTLKDLNGGFYI